MAKNIDEIVIGALKKIDFYGWYDVEQAKKLLDVFWVVDVLEIKPSLFRRREKDSEGILGAYIVGHVMAVHEIASNSLGPLDTSLLAAIIGLTASGLSNYCTGLMEPSETEKGGKFLYPPALVAIDRRFAYKEPIIVKKEELKTGLEGEPKPIKEIRVNPFIDRLQENSVHSLTATALLRIFLVPLELLMKKNYDIGYFRSQKFGYDCDEKIDKISRHYSIDRLSKLINAVYFVGCQIIEDSMTKNGIYKGSIINVHKRYGV